jgi:hypothetical protein
MTKDINKELQDGIFEKIYQFQKVFQPHTQDSPIIDLIEDEKDGNLICNPEYQRKFVWSVEKQSYFIESILYGIDTPIIYFVEAEQEVHGHKKLIKETIDGRQRLGTIFMFYNDKLVLKGLKKNTPLYHQLEGYSFTKLLPKFQNAFKGYSVRTVTFKLVDTKVDLDTQLKFKYQLFQRYNSGLTALNQQEIRNCRYQKNDFLKMFKRISQSETFLKLCPFFKEDPRMGGDEFVTLLYFLSIYDYSLYSKESKNPFINQCYEKIDDKENQIYNLEIDNEKDTLEVSDENEINHDDNQIDEVEERNEFFTKTEKAILDNINKTLIIYGSKLKGNRQERYLIEVLYYYFYKNKKINKTFIKVHASDFGNFIHNEIEKREAAPYPSGQDFNLVDCFKDRVAHTARINYKFSEIDKIINDYFKLKKDE